MNAPVFVAYTHSSSNIHISVGIEPETLCESKDIRSSSQLDNQRLEDIMSEKDVCQECESVWDSVKSSISIERTVVCHRCDNVYSSYLARSVENMSEGIVPICRPCYKDLFSDDDSGIDISYEESEPFFDASNEKRTCNIEDLLGD
jgi:hypothetical protein